MPGTGPDKLLRVAQVLKPNGADGEFVMGFSDYAPENLTDGEPVFICYDGLPVPFFVSSFVQRGASKALVRLEGIDSSKDVMEILGQPVYMDAALFEDEQEEGLQNLIGWVLLDQTGRKLGEISDFEDIPGNPCLCVQTSGGQSLVPLHEDLILSVNSEERKITMTIPDGLI